MNTIHTLRSTRLVALALSASLALMACGKKETSSENSSAPSLNDALSGNTQEKVQERVTEHALPKADLSIPLTEYRKIESGHDFMFLYHALSGIPPEMEKIAQKYSSEYARSSDEFRKRDVLKAIEPRLKQEIARAGAQRYFIYEIDQRLEHYDFDKQEFNLAAGLGGGSDSTWYVSDNHDYQVQFGNADDYKALKVTDETLARAMEKDVGGYQAFTLVVYAFAQDIAVHGTNVRAQIVKVKLLDKKGKELLMQ